RIAEFQTVTGELRPRTFDWKVKWDDLSEELEISCGSTPANVSTVTMSHWMPVARGGRWPGAARVTFGTGPDARQKRIEFVSVAALEASSTVPPPVFPKDVVLYELSTGRSLDSNLQPVQATANGAPATTSPPQSSEPALRWGTLAGGSLALALAGTVWYIRRVRRQRSV
ncbi:MAG: hypothetical protein K2Q09_11010, partial [Phycisphaerales bacterium]|nr:hypothetical protein [Phycisphaerales bacterium]